MYPSSSPDHPGVQGWTQLTDRGRIALAKKEKNVFVLDGTSNAGVAACEYTGSAPERATQANGPRAC